jgi:CRP-like cAMP-binding protein
MPLPRPSPLLPPPPGQVILQQDHVLHSVVFISRGFVDVSVFGQLLETLGPDDHMAELALLPVPATLGEEVRLTQG